MWSAVLQQGLPAPTLETPQGRLPAMTNIANSTFFIGLYSE
jgi:hypothetical protein